MAHAVTGKDGAVTWGGGAINGKLRDWRVEFTASVVANDRGSGETWESRLPIAGDWKATFTAYALDQADWSLSSAAAETSLLGATSTLSLKRKSGDTNPWFTSTGLCTGITRRHDIGAASEYEVTVECSEGSGPTIDTTPAT